MGMFLLLDHFSDVVYAQTIPAGQDLSAQAERFRQEYSIEKKMLDVKKQPPAIEVKEETPHNASGKVVFELKEVHVTGIKPKEQDILSYTWQPYIGKKVTMDDLQDIVDHIKRIYKKAGYLTSMAYLPAQDIKDGIVEIKIMEGKMGKLTIEGNKRFSKVLIGSYFSADRDEVLNFKKIQKEMVRLNGNPDLNVKTIIAAGQEPGTTDVTLKVNDRNPNHVSVGFDNQGTRLVGRYRESLSVSSSNFTGHQDLMYLTTIFSTNSSGQYMAYRLPVGTRGFKAGLDLGYFTLKLGKEFKPLDIRGDTKVYTPNVSWELYTSEEMQANYHAGVKIKDIKKKEGDIKITDEQLRLPYIGIDVTRFDATGQTTFAPEVSFGTSGFLGASNSKNPLASRQGTGGGFAKYTHSLSRTQKMPKESYLQIKSQFQAPTHTLPSTEQFQLGGESSIRGYPEGDYLADLGGSLNVDWIFPMYFIPDSLKLKFSNVSLRHQIEPFVFLDVGGGELLKALPTEAKYKFLAGGGGGLRIHLTSSAYVKLEWADHFGNKPVRGTGPSTFDISVQMGT
jgi:hemolysin activation/secretion protein